MSVKTIALFIFMIISVLAVGAAHGEDFVHHVIVLIDRSESMVNPEKEKATQACRKMVIEQLDEVCFTEGMFFEDPKRALLNREKNDSLSILSFGLEKECPDLDDFIQPISIDNDDYLCETNFSDDIFDVLLRYEITDKNENCKYSFFNYHWSFVSIAVPMSVYYLRNEKIEKPVHRTFIVFISDEEYNVKRDDPALELNALKKLKCKNPSDSSTCFCDIEEVLKICYSVQENYIWREIGGSEKFESKAKKDPCRVMALRVIEVIPNMKHFAIESVCKFDNTGVRFRKTSNGYESDFQIRPEMKDQFEISHIDATLIKQNEEKDDLKYKLSFIKPIPGSYVQLRIENDRVEFEDLALKLKFRVRWKDDVYGKHELHPDGSVLQGRNGLNREIPVYKAETKYSVYWVVATIVLGLLLLLFLFKYIVQFFGLLKKLFCSVFTLTEKRLTENDVRDHTI